MTAVAYIAYERDEDKRRRAEQDLAKAAEDRHVTIENVFAERAREGGPIERPAFADLLKHIEQREQPVTVLVANPSRVARRLGDVVTLVSAVASRGCTVSTLAAAEPEIVRSLQGYAASNRERPTRRRTRSASAMLSTSGTA